MRCFGQSSKSIGCPSFDRRHRNLRPQEEGRVCFFDQGLPLLLFRIFCKKENARANRMRTCVLWERMDDLRMHLFPDGHSQTQPPPPHRPVHHPEQPAAVAASRSSREAELLYLLAKKTQELERVGAFLSSIRVQSHSSLRDETKKRICPKKKNLCPPPFGTRAKLCFSCVCVCVCVCMCVYLYGEKQSSWR